MFTHWLFNVFPGEMRQGWRLVRRDLVLWIALFTLLAVASVAIPQEAEPGPGLPALIAAVTAILGTVLPAILFDAARRETEVIWGDIAGVIARRLLPLLAYSLIAAGISYGLATLTWIASGTILSGTPMAEIVPSVISLVVLVSILVRFCFLPFVILLNDRAEIPPAGNPIVDNPGLQMLAWPLVASWRLGENIRWSITPYVVISRLGPMAAMLVPPDVLLPFLVVWQLLLLTAQAVLFEHFVLARRRLGFPEPAEAPAKPES